MPSDSVRSSAVGPVVGSAFRPEGAGTAGHYRARMTWTRAGVAEWYGR
jgi:hypothetical protein